MRRVDRGLKVENGSARWMGLHRPQSSIHSLFVAHGDHEPQLRNEPLTPTLSPSEGERESRGQRFGGSGAPSMFGRRGALPLLSKGEGSGEGERGARFSRLLDVTISLRHRATSRRSE